MMLNSEQLKNSFIPELGVARCDTFSKSYPFINHHLLGMMQSQESRAGATKEILNFKTILNNPYRRCVGGFHRNINIFFLIAEALWIFEGNKDVKFLTLFNKKMSDFSDDGVVFHAPYGFRLRHWGVRPEDKFIEENLHASQGHDQIADAIKILSENSESRQVVLQIWNPDFDLGIKSKDLPCNDTLMLKIRDGKLFTTIQNRSNDLHWGLPTNIFQFSFLSEMMAGCLGIELGQQVHNSQSLHIYDWNDTAKVMESDFERKVKDNSNVVELYEVAREQRFDFSFDHEVPGNRLRELDQNLTTVIDFLKSDANGKKTHKEELESIKSFSLYLYVSYQLCKYYLEYKAAISHKTTDGGYYESCRISAIEKIEDLCSEENHEIDKWDIVVLAKNFFFSRLTETKHEFLGTL